MNLNHGRHLSLWRDMPEVDLATTEHLGEVRADVIVAGAGLTGITTALLLQQAGLRVAVIEDPVIVSWWESTTLHYWQRPGGRFERQRARTAGTRGGARKLQHRQGDVVRYEDCRADSDDDERQQRERGLAVPVSAEQRHVHR